MKNSYIDENRYQKYVIIELTKHLPKTIFYQI